MVRRARCQPLWSERFSPPGLYLRSLACPANRGDTEQAILECYADMCVGFTDCGGQLAAVNKFSPQEKSGTRYFFRMANAPDHAS